MPVPLSGPASSAVQARWQCCCDGCLQIVTRRKSRGIYFCRLGGIVLPIVIKKYQYPIAVTQFES